MEHQHHPDLIAEARRHMEGIISFMQKSTETVRWDQENENVLDYGCGNGRNTLRLLLPQIEKTGSKLYAVDVDEGKVEEAKINCAHPSATYAVGNILGEFPFKNIKFDKVFSFYVLNYIPDIKSTLAGLSDLLKPSGQLAFTIHKTYFYDAVRTLCESDKWKEITNGYDNLYMEYGFSKSPSNEATFEKLMKDAGFKVISIEFQDMHQAFGDMDQFLNRMMQTFPFKVPENLKRELREDFRAVVAQITGIPPDSKPFEYRYQGIAVAGVKV